MPSQQVTCIAYPADASLIPLYERVGRPNIGRALETVILHELLRRGAEVGYVRTRDGFQVDFHAQLPGGAAQLVQVCAETTTRETWDREVRALQAALAENPTRQALLITLDVSPPRWELPEPIEWRPAAQWLLEEAAG